MSAYRGVDFFGGHDCSGHSLGNNQERYLDQNILAMPLPSEYALNGWLYTVNSREMRTVCAEPVIISRRHITVVKPF